MLKSYDFFELSQIEKGIKDKGIFDREIEIIKNISYSFKKEEEPHCCPACGGEAFIFFRIWNRAYYRCGCCKTVFMNPFEEDLIALNNNKELTRFRSSKEYQNDIEARRSVLWDDLIFWLKYRIFRYLGSFDEVALIDFENRYSALVARLSSAFRSYGLRETFIDNKCKDSPAGSGQAVLYLDQIQRYKDPCGRLMKLGEALDCGGLLFLSARVGTGLDILTMKGNITNVLPYEHVTLLSIEGVKCVLNKSGYDVLEITTPGVMDVKYLIENAEKIPPGNEFIKLILEKSDEPALSELQRFLQKNLLSSYAQIVARKRGDCVEDI